MEDGGSRGSDADADADGAQENAPNAREARGKHDMSDTEGGVMEVESIRTPVQVV